MGFLENLLISTFDPKYGWLGRPTSGALRSGIDLARGLPRQLAPIFTPWLDPKNFEENPETTQLLDELLGGGLKEKLIDEPVSQNAGFEETVPVEQLIRAALFPDITTADIGPEYVSDELGGTIKTQPTAEDLEYQVNRRHQLGGAGESIAGFMLDPTNLAIPAAPGIGAAFLPGIAENLGTNIGNEEYGKALIDVLFGGLIAGHTAKAATRGLEEVVETPVEKAARVEIPEEGFRVPESERVLDFAPIDPSKFEKDTAERQAEPYIPGKAKQIYETRLINMLDAYVRKLEPELGKVFADVEPGNIIIEIDRSLPLDQGASFSKELNTMYINPDSFADLLPSEVSRTVLHELAHTREQHSLNEREPLTREIPAETDPSLVEHTWENIEANAKLNPIEAKFKTGQDILMNNPEVFRISKMFENNVGNLNAVEFRRARGLPTFEEKGESLPNLQAAPKSEKVVSESANILRKILTRTKLTKFNKDTLVETLESKGIPVPEEIRTQLPELLEELKNRGWVNEKVGDTYSLVAGPPREKIEAWKAKRDATPEEVDLEAQLSASLEKLGEKKEVPTKEVPTPPVKTPNLEETMREKLTDDEIRAIGNIFGGARKSKSKEKSTTPPEVKAAQEAAIKGGTKKEEKPPDLESELVEEEGTRKSFEVTLSDGTTHRVQAQSPEAAKLAAEKVLSEYNSTKTVDKVEESLNSLQRAAKYEIEPVREGTERVSEDVREVKELQSEAVTLGKQEEQLRKAQTKEKFQKKTFTVNLSNGRTTTVKARNEARAREFVESKIKQTKPGITITSVAEKPSPSESAITGVGKKIEESAFLKYPVVRVLSAIKVLAYGGDVGHLLRQGKQMNSDLLFSKYAKKTLEQIPVIIRSARSQEFFDNFHEKLYSDPTIKMMVDDFNLDMPGLGANLKEEVFHGGGLAEEIPGIGKFYAKPSERAYTAGLNFLRAAEVRKLTDNLQKKGLTPDNAPEKYEAVARAVNIISQRGDFNPAWKKIFSDASAIYGAPRAKAARLQNAAELFRGGTSGDIVRTTAAKTMAFNASLYGLLAATTGAEFITDPERSDFGKFRINDKISVDPWVGLGVTARTIAKLMTGRSVSPYTGKSRDIAPSEAVTQELLGGLAPGVKLLWEVFSGKDVRGYQVDRVKAFLNVTPLTAKNIVELLQTGDIEDALLLSMLQIGGEGVDVFDYEKARAEEKRLKEKRGLGSSKKKRTYVN